MGKSLVSCFFDSQCIYWNNVQTTFGNGQHITCLVEAANMLIITKITVNQHCTTQKHCSKI